MTEIVTTVHCEVYNEVSSNLIVLPPPYLVLLRAGCLPSLDLGLAAAQGYPSPPPRKHELLLLCVHLFLHHLKKNYYVLA